MIKILLLDHSMDEPICVRRLLPELQGSQFTIHTATDDSSILDALSRNNYDVCLIDSILGDGLKLVGRLRSLGCNIPVILITSNNAGEVLLAIRNGIIDCLIRDQLTAAGLERSVWRVVDQDRAGALQDQRERRYLALFDYSDATIFTCDLDGRFTSVNRAGERLMGFTEDEMLKRSLFDVVSPEDLIAIHNVMQQAVDAQRRITAQIILITKEGCSRSVEICAHPVCRYGRTVELQAIARTVNAEAPRLPLTQTSHLVGADLKDKANLAKKNLAA
ncbi:MAG TPA: PAS domain S-box protein [Pyrinomonadaceae bacterium]|nr:PAS domain S-box protein [Pyrinomonadaceae bacterium]